MGRRRLELRMLVRYLRDGWAGELLRTRFVRHHTPDKPPTIGVELTNVCQLRCPHCDAQHPDIRGKPGYMTEETFGRLVDQLRELRVRNLRIIGGGEPLLHPRVPTWLPRLRRLGSLVTLTTNGQRLTPALAETVLDNLDILEISVAGDNVRDFARSRTGGDFRELLVNLERLRALRVVRRSNMLIHIRVMIRPSELGHVDRLLAFWQRYADAVSTQRLQDYFTQEGDVFVRGVTELYPPCTLPFRALGVGWDGDVPLCRTSAFQTKTTSGLVLGNINATTLAAIWQGHVLEQYRLGHRYRDPGRMTVFRNCPDPQRPAWHKQFDTNRHFARAAAQTDGVIRASALLRRVSGGRPTSSEGTEPTAEPGSPFSVRARLFHHSQ